MRKIIYLFFTVVLLCSLTACKKNGNTDIQETSCMSSKILIRNTLDHELKSMGITWMPDKEALSTNVMMHADHSLLTTEEVPFEIYENELSEDTELSDFGFKLSIVDSEDREWWIEIYHPIEMGKEYRYVLGNDDGRFRIWREQDPVRLDLILNDPHQLVDFESMNEIFSEEAVQPFAFMGPWHLEEESVSFDLSDVFTSYAELGSAMEIRSNGQISWHIGAEAWIGEYRIEQDVIQADVKSLLDDTEKTWKLRLSEKEGKQTLRMERESYSLVWIYGEP